jgi:hypothetical protein
MVGLAPQWGEWYKCPRCELEYVHPLTLAESPEDLYAHAYRGERQESAMQEFSDRVAQRDAFMADPSLWFWTPAFEKTITWLKGQVPEGSTVLEIGSGLGFVLRTLRDEGFDAVGLDVAEPVVDLNRNDGFRMWHGAVETVRSDWIQPAAIVSFFMLHHVPDPLGFLKTIRAQWPLAPLSMAQYGPSNRDSIRSTPPRTLTRWNSTSIRTAFEEAGYRPSVLSIPSTGVEAGFLRPIRRLLRPTIQAPSVHRLQRRIERRLLPRVLQGFQQDEYVVLAIGAPN